MTIKYEGGKPRKFWINLSSEKRGSECLIYEALSHEHYNEPPLTKGHEYVGQFLSKNKMAVIEHSAYQKAVEALNHIRKATSLGESETCLLIHEYTKKELTELGEL